jgi:hypothetical protein
VTPSHRSARRRLFAHGAMGAAVVAAGVAPCAARPALAAVPPALGKLPPMVIASAGELRRLGAGTMRWFGLHVYDAALWVRGPQWEPDDVYALDLLYGRDLSGKALAESSITEMKRVGFNDEAQHARWLTAMTRVFPNVTRGDRIVGVHRAGSASFYAQDRALGVIDDPMFATAFFSIWLDPKTREPQLRARLLGKS